MYSLIFFLCTTLLVQSCSRQQSLQNVKIILFVLFLPILTSSITEHFQFQVSCHSLQPRTLHNFGIAHMHARLTQQRGWSVVRGTRRRMEPSDQLQHVRWPAQHGSRTPFGFSNAYSLREQKYDSTTCQNVAILGKRRDRTTFQATSGGGKNRWPDDRHHFQHAQQPSSCSEQENSLIA